MWNRVVFFVSTLFWSYVLSQDCTTPLGRPSNCVSLYDCPSLVNAFEQNPLPNNVVSFLRQSQCGFDGYKPKVCCGTLPASQPTPRPHLSQDCTTPLGRPSNCVSLYDCPSLVNAFEQNPLPNNVVSFLRQSQCGFDGYKPKVCCGTLPASQPTPRPHLSQDCTTPLGRPSNCVSLYDCPSLVNAFEQNPLPNNVVSFLRQSQCGFDGYKPKVCCGTLPASQPTPRPHLSQDCTTPLGRPSNCVSLYDCPNLVNAFEQNPLPNNVVSFLRQSQCGFDGYTPKVCCGPLPASQPTPRPTPRPTARPTIPNDVIDDNKEDDSSPALSNQCGVDTTGDRIYGGQITDIDEFPWMALLGYRTRQNKVTYQCGGVLINHRYILTAAHCVTGAIEREVGTLVTARLGEYDTQTDVDCLDSSCADPPQELPVASYYPHPGYVDTNKNRRNDIGIVRLARRAKYSYYVQPICLPDSRERLAAGNDVFVAGWGKTLEGRNSNVKLKLGLPIFSKEECTSKYRNLGAVLGDKQICAGGVLAQDTCRGDSGGPLMRKKPNGIWESVGIVSFGYGCGRDGWPGVYTSVAGYIDWIRSTLQSSNQ